MGFELTMLVVIGTDWIGSCKSNYHMIMTVPVSFGHVGICIWLNTVPIIKKNHFKIVLMFEIVMKYHEKVFNCPDYFF